MNMKKTLILGLVVFLFLLSVQPSEATAPLQGPLDLEGTLNGAPYKIRVPVEWNGTLLVYAHGYSDKADHPGETDNRRADAAPGGTLFEDVLLSQGYAVAGSAYLDTGWAVREGIADTLALVSFFKGRVGEPQRTILWGFSLGSVVALKSAEEFPNVYDGVIAACGLGAGTTRNWDGAGALALAYDATLGWPAAWGTAGDVRDNLDFETEVVPVLRSQVLNQMNFGRFEFIRLVNGLPAQDFYTGSNWLFTDFYFATEARAELERRAGGPVVQNLNHTYTLTDEQKAYLGSLGVDAEALLAAMNARRNIAAPASARRYLENYADYAGNILNPVLTIHTVVDGLVVPANESVYRATVEAAGRQANLVQVYTNGVGHCRFTPEQLLLAVQAMESWLETDALPSSEFFPADFGFVPDFVPPPWPLP
jgi:pimeloyl-ACP methyl ester carboxylesterase